MVLSYLHTFSRSSIFICMGGRERLREPDKSVGGKYESSISHNNLYCKKFTCMLQGSMGKRFWYVLCRYFCMQVVFPSELCQVRKFLISQRCMNNHHFYTVCAHSNNSYLSVGLENTLAIPITSGGNLCARDTAGWLGLNSAQPFPLEFNYFICKHSGWLHRSLLGYPHRGQIADWSCYHYNPLVCAFIHLPPYWIDTHTYYKNIIHNVLDTLLNYPKASFNFSAMKLY